MNFLHISTSDNGGAGIAALRLHKTMVDADMVSHFLCLNKSTDIDTVVQHPKFYPRFYHRLLTSLGFPITKTEKNYFRQLKLRTTIQPEMFSFPETDYRIHEHRLFKEADIIIIHWVADFLDYETFFQNFPDHKKLFWYMHDFSILLGGFHTLFDSEKFNDNTINSLERQIEQKKRNYLSKAVNLNFIANSKFTYSVLKTSNIKNEEYFHCVPLGIPKSELKKIDKKIAKKALGFAKDEFVVLMASASISSELKGIDRLFEVFNSDPELKKKCMVVTLGSDMPKHNQGIRFKHLGSVWNPIFKSIVFSAADVVISTSYEETFGQTIIEGYACGTSAIVFNNAALPELIEPSNTGFIVSNSQDCASRLNLLILNPKIALEMGKNAFEKFNQYHTSEIQLQNLLNVIKESKHISIKIDTQFCTEDR